MVQRVLDISILRFRKLKQHILKESITIDKFDKFKIFNSASQNLIPVEYVTFI